MRNWKQNVGLWAVIILVVSALTLPVSALLGLNRGGSGSPAASTWLKTKTVNFAVQMHPQSQLSNQPSKYPPYALQVGSPRYLPAFTHADEKCAWTGIAGQVFDKNGFGVEDLAVFVSGDLHGQAINQMGFTTQNSSYGPGGYEVSIPVKRPETGQLMQVQVFDMQGQQVSEPYFVTLSEDCEKRLVIVNFQARLVVQKITLPWVMNYTGNEDMSSR